MKDQEALINDAIAWLEASRGTRQIVCVMVRLKDGSLDLFSRTVVDGGLGENAVVIGTCLGAMQKAARMFLEGLPGGPSAKAAAMVMIEESDKAFNSTGGTSRSVTQERKGQRGEN